MAKFQKPPGKKSDMGERAAEEAIAKGQKPEAKTANPRAEKRYGKGK